MKYINKEKELTNKELSEYKETKKIFREGIKGFGQMLGFIAFLSTFILCRPTMAAGMSMYPAVSGSAIYLTQSTWVADKLERYDIVGATVISQDGTENIDVLKRVIGMPGETITYIGTDLYIDGELFINPYVAEGYEATHGIEDGSSITLGEDEYFLLGDNQSNSYDSRIFGAVNIEDIISVVIYMPSSD